MRALRIVLAGLILLYPWAAADAQQNAGPSGPPPQWTPVPGCQTANALGPQVYMDAASGAPNAAQEMQLLNQALKLCQSQAPGASQGPSAGQAPDGLVVPENGSPDPNAPPPNAGPPPDYGPPPNNDPQSYSSGPPPNGSGAGGGGFPGVLQAMQSLAQLFFQYCDGPGGGSNACSNLGWLNPGAGYGGAPQYSAPPGYYGNSSFQSSIPSYARPASSAAMYGNGYDGGRQASGYYRQPWNNQQGYYPQPWNTTRGSYQQPQSARPSYARPYSGGRGGAGYGRQVYNAARSTFTVARKAYTAVHTASRLLGPLRYIR